MLSYEKTFYTIAEVSKELNVPPSTLRFWQTKFPKIVNPRTNGKGDRQYTQKDIGYLRQIKNLLKDQGMTIAGAQDKLKKRHANPENETMLDTLTRIREELEGIRTTLNQFKENEP